MTNLLGKRFGRLTVLKLAERKQSYLSNGRKNGFINFWLCECDCGNKKIIQESSLTNNKTQSCGCLLKEKAKETTNKKHTHRQTGTRLYRIWLKMKERCNYKKAKRYKDWGGRGIKVCADWERFENFFEWATKNGYKENLTIDRINNNGDYEPKNCRWATYKEQGRNTRTNYNIEYKGETHCISQWAEITGIPDYKIRQRIKKLKWTIEKALTTP